MGRTHQQIEKKVKEIIAEYIGLEVDKIDNNSYFAEDLNLTEEDLYEIGNQLEDILDLKIDVEDALGSLIQVNDLITLIIRDIENDDSLIDTFDDDDYIEDNELKDEF
jgi:acyl carrier protein